jgi:hypothetical protein
MNSSPGERRTALGLFAWEARWICVEMAGTALGLFFAMGYDSWDVAGVWLFSLCIVSFVVRWRHYSIAA